MRSNTQRLIIILLPGTSMFMDGNLFPPVIFHTYSLLCLCSRRKYHSY